MLMRSPTARQEQQRSTTRETFPVDERRRTKVATSLSATAVRKAVKRAADPAAVSEIQEAPAHIPVPLDLSQKTVTVKEAAFRLRKSEDAIYCWLRSGRLKGWQPGGRGCAILVLEASVDEAMLCSFEIVAPSRHGRGLAV